MPDLTRVLALALAALLTGCGALGANDAGVTRVNYSRAVTAAGTCQESAEYVSGKEYAALDIGTERDSTGALAGVTVRARGVQAFAGQQIAAEVQQAVIQALTQALRSGLVPGLALPAAPGLAPALPGVLPLAPVAPTN